MDNRRIVWLASYPKSGNTWFRAFLTALLGETDDIDINGLKTPNIFSSRNIFDDLTDLDSTSLYDSEVKVLIPESFTFLAKHLKTTEYIKIHDAYTLNIANQPIVPTEVTKCAIYLIRNPLDIAASFASHMGSTIDHAIDVMNNPNGCLASQKNNHNTENQFRQLMFSWSDHARSWTEQSDVPVFILRYEDLLANTFDSFQKVIQFIGVEVSEDAIRKAIEATQFKKLKEKEIRFGFKEKVAGSKEFFRTGTAGKWKEELTKEQIAKIINAHGEMMRHFGYL